LIVLAKNFIKNIKISFIRMKENYKTQEKIYDAEVLESSTFDENIIFKFLIKE